MMHYATNSSAIGQKVAQALSSDSKSLLKMRHVRFKQLFFFLNKFLKKSLLILVGVGE